MHSSFSVSTKLGKSITSDSPWTPVVSEEEGLGFCLAWASRQRWQVTASMTGDETSGLVRRPQATTHSWPTGVRKIGCSPVVCTTVWDSEVLGISQQMLTKATKLTFSQHLAWEADLAYVLFLHRVHSKGKSIIEVRYLVGWLGIPLIEGVN